MKYRDENIIISLPINYGDMEYAKQIEDYARSLFKEKVEIINKYMPYTQYVKYISTVDCCILDYKHQSALGNIYLLLKNGTKLFLNKDGIIKLSLSLEAIETYNIDDMSFDEFSKKSLIMIEVLNFLIYILMNMYMLVHGTWYFKN